ncbi:hypothetical protein [Nonomuraea candida]|uniref:hypothetical protein n=1 Tax=Nonomuraea candida TaxID=359159 RepID=UPI000693D37A|nr:hypothetical protein [Nonomuraea candida]
MTRYAIDRARNVLIAHWGTGIGDTATTVADLPSPLPYHGVLRLADCLGKLSRACWRCYTHPAGAADRHGPGSIGWHRQRERDAFAFVPAMLAPAERGGDEPATKVEAAAHAVGRALRDVGSTRLTAYVTTDVTAELAAIEQAERGDLTERAQQAVTLTREDASPLQISQADLLLRHDPFDAEAIVTQIDPTAAAIAAAHWLYAAVAVTARHTGTHPVQVVVASDRRAKPLATESLTDVVAAIGAGGRPRQVVMTLIRNALHIAEGHLHGISDARHRITAAEQLIEQAHTDHPGLDLGPDTVHLPLTCLDPARPAPDLLENLLHGIRSCRRLYERHAGRGAGDPPHGAFLAAVRREAAVRGGHLL